MGDACSYLYEVHAGCFKTCVASESGRTQVSGFYVVGDLMGLDGVGSERRVSEGVALEDSQVNVVSYDDLSKFGNESADLQHRFHKIMGRELEHCRRMMFVLGSMRATEKVATFLLDLLQRLSARGYSASSLNLCMTRDDIGSYLGLTLETVSRSLSRLKRCGILEVTNRLIQVLDSEGLRRAAAGLHPQVLEPALIGSDLPAG